MMTKLTWSVIIIMNNCYICFSDLCELRDHNELAGEEIEETKEKVSYSVLEILSIIIINFSYCWLCQNLKKMLSMELL